MVKHTPKKSQKADRNKGRREGGGGGRGSTVRVSLAVKYQFFDDFPIANFKNTCAIKRSNTMSRNLKRGIVLFLWIAIYKLGRVAKKCPIHSVDQVQELLRSRGSPRLPP